jgi:hypothetical protein
MMLIFGKIAVVSLERAGSIARKEWRRNGEFFMTISPPDYWTGSKYEGRALERNWIV